MTKHICDRCRLEVSETARVIADLAGLKADLCPDCTKALKDYLAGVLVVPIEDPHPRR